MDRYFSCDNVENNVPLIKNLMGSQKPYGRIRIHLCNLKNKLQLRVYLTRLPLTIGDNLNNFLVKSVQGMSSYEYENYYVTRLGLVLRNKKKDTLTIKFDMEDCMHEIMIATQTGLLKEDIYTDHCRIYKRGNETEMCLRFPFYYAPPDIDEFCAYVVSRVGSTITYHSLVTDHIFCDLSSDLVQRSEFYKPLDNLLPLCFRSSYQQMYLIKKRPMDVWFSW